MNAFDLSTLNNAVASIIRDIALPTQSNMAQVEGTGRILDRFGIPTDLGSRALPHTGRRLPYDVYSMNRMPRADQLVLLEQYESVIKDLLDRTTSRGGKSTSSIQQMVDDLSEGRRRPSDPTFNQRVLRKMGGQGLLAQTALTRELNNDLANPHKGRRIIFDQSFRNLGSLPKAPAWFLANMLAQGALNRRAGGNIRFPMAGVTTAEGLSEADIKRLYRGSFYGGNEPRGELFNALGEHLDEEVRRAGIKPGPKGMVNDLRTAFQNYGLMRDGKGIVDLRPLSNDPLRVAPGTSSFTNYIDLLTQEARANQMRVLSASNPIQISSGALGGAKVAQTDFGPLLGLLAGTNIEDFKRLSPNKQIALAVELRSRLAQLGRHLPSGTEGQLIRLIGALRHGDGLEPLATIRALPLDAEGNPSPGNPRSKQSGVYSTPLVEERHSEEASRVREKALDIQSRPGELSVGSRSQTGSPGPLESTGTERVSPERLAQAMESGRELLRQRAMGAESSSRTRAGQVFKSPFNEVVELYNQSSAEDVGLTKGFKDRKKRLIARQYGWAVTGMRAALDSIAPLSKEMNLGVDKKTMAEVEALRSRLEKVDVTSTQKTAQKLFPIISDMERLLSRHPEIRGELRSLDHFYSLVDPEFRQTNAIAAPSDNEETRNSLRKIGRQAEKNSGLSNRPIDETDLSHPRWRGEVSSHNNKQQWETKEFPKPLPGRDATSASIERLARRIGVIPYKGALKPSLVGDDATDARARSTALQDRDLMFLDAKGKGTFARTAPVLSALLGTPTPTGKNKGVITGRGVARLLGLSPDQYIALKHGASGIEPNTSSGRASRRRISTEIRAKLEYSGQMLDVVEQLQKHKKAAPKFEQIVNDLENGTVKPGDARRKILRLASDAGIEVPQHKAFNSGRPTGRQETQRGHSRTKRRTSPGRAVRVRGEGAGRVVIEVKNGKEIATPVLEWASKRAKRNPVVRELMQSDPKAGQREFFEERTRILENLKSNRHRSTARRNITEQVYPERAGRDASARNTVDRVANEEKVGKILARAKEGVVRLTVKETKSVGTDNRLSAMLNSSAAKKRITLLDPNGRPVSARGAMNPKVKYGATKSTVTQRNDKPINPRVDAGFNRPENIRKGLAKILSEPKLRSIVDRVNEVDSMDRDSKATPSMPRKERAAIENRRKAILKNIEKKLMPALRRRGVDVTDPEVVFRSLVRSRSGSKRSRPGRVRVR